MKVKKGENEKDFMKMLKLHMLTVTVRSVFAEDRKYYPQGF